jgi:hypothetical protein
MLIVAMGFAAGGSLLTRRRFGISLRVWLVMLAVLIMAATTGWVFSKAILGTPLLPRGLVSHGHVLSMVLFGLVAAVTLPVSRFCLSRCERQRVWAAFWFAEALAAFALAVVAPDFSHLLLFPGLAAVVAAFAVRDLTLRSLLTAWTASVMLIPVAHLISIALGPASGLLLGPVYALVLLPLLPLLSPDTGPVVTG